MRTLADSARERASAQDQKGVPLVGRTIVTGVPSENDRDRGLVRRPVNYSADEDNRGLLTSTVMCTSSS